MSKPLELTGTVVLITGDGRGLAGTIARAFLSTGADVVSCDTQDSPSTGEDGGRQTHFKLHDLNDPEQIKACMDFVKTRFGHLDVLVTGNLWAEADVPCASTAATIIRRGLITPLHFCQAANHLMQGQQNGGSIINITCSTSPEPSPQPATGEAANSGLANLGSSLAIEWAPRVRVNTIALDLTQTEQSARRGDHEAEDAAGAVASPPVVEAPGGICGACLFLASSLASYISGSRVTASHY